MQQFQFLLFLRESVFSLGSVENFRNFCIDIKYRSTFGCREFFLQEKFSKAKYQQVFCMSKISNKIFKKFPMCKLIFYLDMKSNCQLHHAVLVYFLLIKNFNIYFSNDSILLIEVLYSAFHKIKNCIFSNVNDLFLNNKNFSKESFLVFFRKIMIII